MSSIEYMQEVTIEELLAENRRLRRAVELSRVWWDDTDPYRGRWNHDKFPCNVRPCAACEARTAAMEALGITEGGRS